MSIAIKVQVFNGTTPVNGLADAPEITVLRGDTAAVVLGPVAMTDLGAGGWYRTLFTPSVPGLDYCAEVDADPLASGQVPAAQRYFGVAFDDELDELYRDSGLDTAAPKDVTENTAETDYTETVPLGGAPITKALVKTGAVTNIQRT